MAAIFRTQKTYGTANSWEVRIDDNSPVDGPYTVIARGLSRSEALFLSSLLNDKGWDHQTAYNAVDALVENDSLHDYLFKAMARAYCATHSIQRVLVQVEISPDGETATCWVCADCVAELSADMLAA